MKICAWVRIKGTMRNVPLNACHTENKNNLVILIIYHLNFQFTSRFFHFRTGLKLTSKWHVMVGYFWRQWDERAQADTSPGYFPTCQQFAALRFHDSEICLFFDTLWLISLPWACSGSSIDHSKSCFTAVLRFWCLTAWRSSLIGQTSISRGSFSSRVLPKHRAKPCSEIPDDFMLCKLFPWSGWWSCRCVRAVLDVSLPQQWAHAHVILKM